jgi:hypothetical protein
MKHLLAAAAATLALAALPAQAQIAAKRNADNVPYCSMKDGVLIGYPDGNFEFNYTMTMTADPARSTYDGGPGMFRATPNLFLFFNFLIGPDGRPTGPILPFSLTASFGRFVEGREAGTPDTLRLRIESGTLRSPPLTISGMARESNRISATLVETNSGLDGYDVTAPQEDLNRLAEASLASGAVLYIHRGDKQIARAVVPARSTGTSRTDALAWASNTYPLLKKGQCPA